MNYYPFHIGDFRSGTSHLSDAEELCYRRLLDWYYDTEAPIPLETQWVSRRLRVDTQTLESVLKDFFACTTDGWRHDRCDEEIDAYKKLREKNRTNGSKGGRPPGKKDSQKNPVGSASDTKAKPLATHSKGNQEPLTINQDYSSSLRSEGADNSSPGDGGPGIDEGPDIEDIPDDAGPAADPQPWPDDHWMAAAPPPPPPAPAPAPTPAPQPDPEPRESLTAHEARKREAWVGAKSLLSEAGMPLKQCGTFVGGLMRQYGEEVALDVIERAVQERPVEPNAWIIAACQAAGGKRGPRRANAHNNLDNVDYSKGVNHDGSFD